MDIARVGVEFEGEHHQQARVFQADLARHNRLNALGWTVLRASGASAARVPVPRVSRAELLRLR